MKLIYLKIISLVIFSALILFAIPFVHADTAEDEKAAWLKIAKDMFDYKLPKGFDVTLPGAAGGGGETYVKLILVPKSKKDKGQITLAVYLPGFPTIEEQLAGNEAGGGKTLGTVKIKKQVWHRYVPAGENAESYECHGAIKGEDKWFEFCMNSDNKAPSAKLKKAYKAIMKSVKIK